ncbi:hypothetical protein HDU96_001045 [Phlyctochytrium bullatum]|nr:hypothetical protein HDU96_001045 [Phlyctochytrium bullatum]
MAVPDVHVLRTLGASDAVVDISVTDLVSSVAISSDRIADASLGRRGGAPVVAAAAFFRAAGEPAPSTDLRGTVSRDLADCGGSELSGDNFAAFSLTAMAAAEIGGDAVGLAGVTLLSSLFSAPFAAVTAVGDVAFALGPAVDEPIPTLLPTESARFGASPKLRIPASAISFMSWASAVTGFEEVLEGLLAGTEPPAAAADDLRRRVPFNVGDVGVPRKASKSVTSRLGWGVADTTGDAAAAQAVAGEEVRLVALGLGDAAGDVAVRKGEVVPLLSLFCFRAASLAGVAVPDGTVPVIDGLVGVPPVDIFRGRLPDDGEAAGEVG